ncbi:MAG: hypothetical protein F083_2871 [bacterium F083]|nr:MAG: hypothetical protein F083_2871 [bacterium F083]
MKRQEQQELSYYGLYLLRYLLEQHSRKAKDLNFIYNRELQAAETFEQARLDGHSVEGAQELAMAELMKGRQRWTKNRGFRLPRNCCLWSSPYSSHTT